MSGWGSYRQCDTERDHFPLESWRFLQIISYCLLISLLSMTWLSSGPACNQIQPEAEVADLGLRTPGLVLRVCLHGARPFITMESFRHRQAHTLLAWSLGPQRLQQSTDNSFPLEFPYTLVLHATVYYRHSCAIFTFGYWGESNKWIREILCFLHNILPWPENGNSKTQVIAEDDMGGVCGSVKI